MSHRNSLIAAVTLAACAVAAPAASADSIAYIKHGDVWKASGDGARQVRLTSTGAYAYVSQADDGSMIALAGQRLHRLSRTGQILADFPTMVSDGGPAPGPMTQLHGPFEPQLSPDGTKVAFEFYNDTYTNPYPTPSCSSSSTPPCYAHSLRQGVAISHADRLTGPDEFGLLTGWIWPSWVSDTTLLRSDPGLSPNDDTVFNEIGPGKGDDEMDHWFVDPGQMGTSDIELARGARMAVGVVGQYEDTLRAWRPLVDPFGAPDWDHSIWAPAGNTAVVERCGDLKAPGKVRTPSIAPDGATVAYQLDDGIHIAGLGAACPAVTSGRLVIPGGRHPDWGPADVPSDAELRGGQDVPPPPGPRPDARVKLALGSAKLRAALRKGLRVTVTGAPKGRIALTAVRGVKTVARGSAVTRSGSARMVLRFTRSARRAFGSARRLTVTIRGAGAATKLTLRR